MIFDNHRLTQEKFQKLVASDCLLLLAYDAEKMIGFKIGYRIDEDTFHSWLGGIHENYRRLGIAQALLETQEQKVTEKGIKRITFNTYKLYSNMRRLGEKNGYHLVRTEIIDGDLKYFYEKNLTAAEIS